MRPRERVIELLKSYPYAITPETTSGPAISARWGSVAHRFSDLYYEAEDSYKELERCLRALRASEPTLYWHVTRRYVYAEVLPMTVPVRRYQHKAVPVLAPYLELAGGLAGHTGRTCRVLVRRWDHRVLPKHVDAAVDWLAAEMTVTQVPPSLLLEAA